MQLDDLVSIFETLAPPALAEPWDNSGLLLRPLQDRMLRRVLLTINLTDAVAQEAVDKACTAVLAYHPMLFRPVNRLDARIAHDRAFMRLIQHDIALYSPHTALDAVPGGVNDWLAEGVGQCTCAPLKPHPSLAGAGQGRLVSLTEPVALDDLVERIKAHLGICSMRLARAAVAKPIRSVALCAGAGGDVLQEVSADMVLTGEMGHHPVLAAVQRGIHVLLCEHTHTERGYLARLADRLRALAPDLEWLLAEQDEEPLHWI